MDRYDILIEKYPALAPLKEQLVRAEETLAASFSAGGKLLCCGNGGSAADCEHIVGELMKSFTLPRLPEAEWEERFAAAGAPDPALLCGGLQKGLPAVALCSHTALATAWCNDAAPELLFAQQVFGLGRKGDVLLAISTSGNSRNVLQAVYVARALGMQVVALTGGTGGKLAEAADVCITVPASVTAEVQEYHLPIYHALCERLEHRFFG